MERIEIQILQSLLKGEISVYQLIDEQDASLPEFFDLFEKLQTKGLLKVVGGKVALTEKGRVVAKNFLKPDAICKACDGTGYKIAPFFREVFNKYSEICKNRPPAVEKFDQGFISEEGVIRRIEFIHERGDIYGSIFVVGDDDLFSLAVSLTGLPKKVVVVDIDERLVNFINSTANEYGLRVEAHVYDVQKAFPEDFRKKFDVFVTDPVETIPGIKLFLSRGVSTLRGIGSSAYFGLTTLEASRNKWFEIERMILEMGFVITDIKRRFNVYPASEKSYSQFEEKLPIFKKLGVKTDYDWYTSSLFRIEAVKDPRPLVEGEMIIDEQVYKDYESLATPY
ncbi:MAG: bis-aminopropyl spermidine synthase family protein [Archaeoglobaceae archaeon]|nr:bis-aminopropyl spermidine synthase family protein [Archaeoglobaceae archaeon]MDW8128706.1 bis-aminopropyl spermidine synthase family protein [Archaeoglobaceae archaeon]